MKLRKNTIVIVVLLLAFIGFFINATIVISEKNKKVQRLKEENEALREGYKALERDLGDLRKEKIEITGKLRERLRQLRKDSNEDASAPDK